jgi:hypothetical protein
VRGEQARGTVNNTHETHAGAAERRLASSVQWNDHVLEHWAFLLTCQQHRWSARQSRKNAREQHVNVRARQATRREFTLCSWSFSLFVVCRG